MLLSVIQHYQIKFFTHHNTINPLGEGTAALKTVMKSGMQS